MAKELPTILPMTSPLNWSTGRLIAVRAWLTLWITLMLPPAFAATTYTEGAWQLQSSTGNQSATSLEDCKAKWRALPAPAKQRTDYCRQQLVTKITADPPIPPQPPTTGGGVFFADLQKGPPGAPLTICGGKIDSVVIGSAIAPIAARQSAVDSLGCVRVVPTKSGSISINGQPSGLSYVITAGSVLYVSLTGDDTKAAKNDPTKPWRYLQTSKGERTGALGAYSPGDVIVLREGSYSDVGYAGRWARLLTRGDVTITSYPGEKVVYSGNSGGGIQGPDSVHAGQAPNVTISSITIVGSPKSASDGCPINLQYGADGWRIVNVDLSWPVAPAGMKCAGIAGHGANVSILGSYIHDIAGGHENHGIYLDGGDGKNGPYEIAWNLVTRVTGGNLLQTFDNYGDDIRGFSIHDNQFTSGARYGLNLSDGTVSGTVTNNLIQDTALSGIRMNFISGSDTDIRIKGNTLTNVNTVGASSSQGAINCDSTVKQGSVVLSANAITPGKGAKDGIYSEYGSCPAVKFQ